MTHLNKLDLSGNQIKGLPENIGNLTNLKHLNLSHNQIATLPPSLGHLKNLRHLDLRNNNLSPKFSDIVGSCQNEVQCQQAAKNVLKTFSNNSDGDKKKKQNAGKVIRTFKHYYRKNFNVSIKFSMTLNDSIEKFLNLLTLVEN